MKYFFNVKKVIFYLIFGILFFQCGSLPKEKCQGSEEALVVDMSTIDGCHDLLLLPDGKKIEPHFKNDNINLIKSKIITFNQSKLDIKPSCHLADYAAQITCISYKENNQSSPCPGETNIAKITWIQPLINQASLRKVLLIEDGKVIFYLLEHVNKNELYSCRGNLLCEFKNGETNECPYEKKLALKKKIIFINEHHPD